MGSYVPGFEVMPLSPVEAAEIEAHGFDPHGHLVLSVDSMGGQVGWGSDPNGLYMAAQITGQIPSAAFAPSRSVILLAGQAPNAPRVLQARLRMVVPRTDLRVALPPVASAWRVYAQLRDGATVPEELANYVTPVLDTRVITRVCLTTEEAQETIRRLRDIVIADRVQITPIGVRPGNEEGDVESGDVG